MITYGLDEDEAFALLRWHSQHTNIKLRDIAAGITDRTNDPDIAGLSADGKITEILTELTGSGPAPPHPTINPTHSEDPDVGSAPSSAPNPLDTTGRFRQWEPRKPLSCA